MSPPSATSGWAPRRALFIVIVNNAMGALIMNGVATPAQMEVHLRISAIHVTAQLVSTWCGRCARERGEAGALRPPALRLGRLLPARCPARWRPAAPAPNPPNPPIPPL